MKTTTLTTSEELFRQATLEGSCLLAQPQKAVINGDDNDNELYGTNGNDQIYGNGGNDLIHGKGGNDSLQGGAGDDIFDGGSGNDWLHGQEGDDTYLFGAAFGQDRIDDSSGTNHIRFSSHYHAQIGFQRSWDDLWLQADKGNWLKVLDFFSNPENGVESIYFTDQSKLELEQIWAKFERPAAQNTTDSVLLEGSRFDDILNGQDSFDILYGYRGNDILKGGGGNDMLYGDIGNDQLSGGADDDTLYGGSGNDMLSGDDGDDKLDGGKGNDQLDGGDGDDKLYGDDGNDVVEGGKGNDRLIGGEGDDIYRFAANFGQDEIVNRNGKGHIEFSHHHRNDIRLSRGSEHDQDDLLIETADGHQITVKWHFNSDADGIENIQFADGSILQAADFLKPHLVNGTAEDNALQGSFGHDEMYGRNGNDKLYAREGDDVLFGGNGNDVLDGGNDSDKIYGDAGNDELYGRYGNDLISGGTGQDVLYAGNGNDKLYGGSGQDKVYGDRGNDQLYGEAGNDLLSGGAGNDRLSGGTGSDVLYGGAGKDTFVFDSALNSSNVDTVKDFSRGTDLLALGKAIFSGLGNSIEAAEFGLGSSATNSSQRILFNQADGKLYYDADGNGSAAAVHFATLQGSGLDQLDHTSFSLI